MISNLGAEHYSYVLPLNEGGRFDLIFLGSGQWGLRNSWEHLPNYKPLIFFFCDVSLCSLMDGNDVSEELLPPFFTLNTETAGSPET